jgi:serine/threonine-protein kinase
MIACRALLAAATITLSAGIAAQQSTAQESWATYRNARFGTTVEYPARFRPGRPPENDDGLSFTAADGATLSVWGSFNALEHDVAGLETFLRESLDGGERITYRAAGRNWLVLSGTHGERIFYRRYVLSHRDEIINAFAIGYPAGVAAGYDPIVARIARSLRPGRGYQTPGNR